MIPDQPRDFLIRLRGDGKLSIHHLRRLLKQLGRRFRLRCIEAVEVPVEEPAHAEEPPETPP